MACKLSKQERLELGYDETSEEMEERMFGSTVDEDDDEEFGCTACGNPAYPKCKSSCNLYDD